MFNLEQFLKDQKSWSEKVFGTGKRTVGLCNHIRHELIEIENDPDNLEEWIEFEEIKHTAETVRFQEELAALKVDRGKNIAFHRLIARKK